MHFLVAGSSGFLGTLLVSHLRASGHDVTTLVRRPPGANEVQWDPYAGPLDPAKLHGIDVVVNLAGSPLLGNPHSDKWARELRRSRVTTTRVLAEAIAKAGTAAFLAGNGISAYGDHGATQLPETATRTGNALLTSVTKDWEDATLAASNAGTRVVVLRTAPVLDRRSAPLKMLAPVFRTGLGGRLGSGRQHFPMISARDWASAVEFAGVNEVSGPINLCCPVTPTNAEFTAELGRQVHRPTKLPVPAFVLEKAAGPMAPELLGSVNAVPAALLAAGFVFQDPDVSAVLRSGLRAH